MHDRDAKFSREFRETLRKHQIKPNPLPFTSPNLNGRTERFIGQIKSECLDKFIFFGRRHLDHVVAEYVHYFNNHRSHSARMNLPPLGKAANEVETVSPKDVEVSTHVGGLIRSFQRKAA